MAAVRVRKTARESLLARYSETLGEMMLRKYTERAIRAAKVESDLANRSKSAFLSTMSHELRTPLNAIIGFSDLIRQMGLKGSLAENVEYAGHIAHAGRRLQDVVSDILDISKLESGSLTLDRQPYQIDEIVDDAIETARDSFAQKHQTLDVRADKNLPILSIDPKRIRQILANLLSNANKFTAERGRILVLTRKLADGGVTIAVADSGIGMTEEQIAIAFKPFGQVQSTYARAQEGTGLGLTIALGLARAHGGDLHLESTPNSGTTVALLLPKSGAQDESLSNSAGGYAA